MLLTKMQYKYIRKIALMQFGAQMGGAPKEDCHQTSTLYFTQNVFRVDTILGKVARSTNCPLSLSINFPIHPLAIEY